MPRPLQISASQLSTFWSCPRKWYFSKVLKLKEPKKGYFTFGTVLHAVAERYAAADDQGRVPNATDFIDWNDPGDHNIPWACEGGVGIDPGHWTDGPLEGQKFGNIADIYPRDWQWSRDWDGNKEARVSEEEAELIQELITEAIEKGLLMRWPGRTLERKIEKDVIPGVKLIGFIDVDIVDPESGVLRIKDYKTFSASSQRFLKTTDEDYLAAVENNAPARTLEVIQERMLSLDPQQNIYAYVRAEELGLQDQPVEVEHVQFPKYRNSRKGVRAVAAMTQPEHRKELWRKIQDTAAEMIDVKKCDDYNELLPANDSACQAYGGCPFATICCGMETVAQFSTTIEEYNKLSQEERDANPRPRVIYKPHADAEASEELQELESAILGGNKKKDMASIFDKKKKGSSKPAAKKDTQPKEEPKAEPATKTAETGFSLPWANPDCPLCKKSEIPGLAHGRPCKICDASAAKRGVPTSSSFSAEELDALMEMAGHSEDPLATRKDEVKEIVEEAKAKAEAEASEQPAKEEVVEEKAPEPKKESKPKADKKAPAEKAEPKTRGRKKKGPLLLINAYPVKESGSTITIQEVLQQYGNQMAEKSGTPYRAMKSFDRRDIMAGCAEQIADELGTALVLCDTMDPDCVALVSALTPFCRVIKGI